MKLYPIPGGLWAGTEADWKKQCKARGIDPKTLPGAREVPVAKADLIEFLNFYAVDVFRTGSAPVAAPADTVVDVEALRAEHNPLPGHGDAPDDKHPDYGVPGTLEAEFQAAPIKLQAQIIVAFIDRLT